MPPKVSWSSGPAVSLLILQGGPGVCKQLCICINITSFILPEVLESVITLNVVPPPPTSEASLILLTSHGFLQLNPLPLQLAHCKSNNKQLVRGFGDRHIK